MDFGGLPAPMYQSSSFAGGRLGGERAHIHGALGEIDANDERRLIAAAIDHRDIGGLHSRMADQLAVDDKDGEPGRERARGGAATRQRVSERRNASRR